MEGNEKGGQRLSRVWVIEAFFSIASVVSFLLKSHAIHITPTLPPTQQVRTDLYKS